MNGDSDDGHNGNGRRPRLARLHVLRTSDGFTIEGSRLDGDRGLEELKAAIGTADETFIRGFFKQLVEACAREGHDVTIFDEDAFNFMLAVIKGNEPGCTNEAMICAHMALTNGLIMRRARELNNATPDEVDKLTNMFVQLTGIFTKQLDALRRFRSGGEQTVTVQHVSVSDGGQAIVGNVSQSKTEGRRTRKRPLAITTDSSEVMPVLSQRNPTVGAPLKRNGTDFDDTIA